MQVKPEEIVNENPLYQRQTARRASCQIDYMIQMKYVAIISPRSSI